MSQGGLAQDVKSFSFAFQKPADPKYRKLNVTMFLDAGDLQFGVHPLLTQS